MIQTIRQDYSKHFSMLALANRKVLKLDALPHSLLQRSFKCFEVDKTAQCSTNENNHVVNTQQNQKIVHKKLSRIYVSTYYKLM